MPNKLEKVWFEYEDFRYFIYEKDFITYEYAMSLNVFQLINHLDRLINVETLNREDKDYITTSIRNCAKALYNQTKYYFVVDAKNENGK